MIAPEPFLRPRGTPLSVYHRIRALQELGHDVELVTYPFGDDPELPGLIIHRAARVPGVRDVGIGPTVAKALLDVPLAATAWRLARTGRFDLVHTHEEAGVIGSFLSRRLGIPHVYDMHSSLPEQFANFGRYDWAPVVATFRRLEHYILGGATGVIAICEELREHVRNLDYRGTVGVIENVQQFALKSANGGAELRRRLDLESGPVVVYTGTHESYQGLDLLLEAAADVRRRVAAVRFLVVGGTARQVAALGDLARARQVDGILRLVPAVRPQEVRRYLEIADVLVTCRTRGTNTPLKIYHYLHAGKPIVATAIRSHTQVLTGEIAELVAPTPAAIAAGITRVLTDHGHARALADGARRAASTRYDERVTIERLRDFLHEVFGEEQPRTGLATLPTGS